MQILEYMQKIDHILLKLIRILGHKHILICPIVDVTPAKIKRHIMTTCYPNIYILIHNFQGKKVMLS